jgi:orotate phosphoribosyltransferase-like protein
VRNKRALLEEFIELRAIGYTFDEIVKELGVSKVTLLRWSKKHYDYIDKTKKEMVRLTAEKIALKNSNLLSKFADLVLSEYKKGKKKPEIEEVLMKRLYRNVFMVYARKMKGLSVKFDKDGKPKDVVIEWKDED